MMMLPVIDPLVDKVASRSRDRRDPCSLPYGTFVLRTKRPVSDT
jgi:hypothetical protein